MISNRRHDRLDQILEDAVAAGVLPATAKRPEQESRPWPVVLLTGLGAWLATIPLLVVVGMLLGDVIIKGPGPYVVGALVLGAAVIVLRAKAVPLFVEQLAVPALLVGSGTLGFGLFRDLPMQLAASVLVVVACGLAASIPRTWLRALLGASAAVLAVMGCLPNSWDFFKRTHITYFWLAWHGGFALWLGAQWLQRNVFNDGGSARLAAAMESIGTGWILAILTGLAVWSGMTFLVAGTLGGGLVGELAREIGPKVHGWDGTGVQFASAAIALAGAAWLARSWPAMRQLWLAGVALVLIVLSWFMPSLGAVLAILAFCTGSGRFRVAAAAGLAAAWIVGSFYYQLAWPLASKALVMIGAAVALGTLAWLASRSIAPSPNRGLSNVTDTEKTSIPIGSLRRTQAAIAFCVLAVLAVANIGIWQKEDIIAHGQPVFVELAPVDPRSLMQGDYMRLRFNLPPRSGDASTQSIRQRPFVVAKRDERGVTTFTRLHQTEPLAADEFLIELTPKNGHWTLVSDGWFFKEGEGERWAKAKYGEFRIGADGRALLIGLRGPNLDLL